MININKEINLSEEISNDIPITELKTLLVWSDKKEELYSILKKVVINLNSNDNQIIFIVSGIPGSIYDVRKHFINKIVGYMPNDENKLYIKKFPEIKIVIKTEEDIDNAIQFWTESIPEKRTITCVDDDNNIVFVITNVSDYPVDAFYIGYRENIEGNLFKILK